MVLISSFSIATGDFKMLSATREAVTTTSLPKTVCVESATCKLEPRLFTSNSWGLNPTDEKTSVNGSFVFVLSRNAPVEFVTVPAMVPLICTLTSGNGKFFSWSVTCPEISMRVPLCEKAKLKNKNCSSVNKTSFVFPFFLADDNALLNFLIKCIYNLQTLVY